MWSLLVRSLPFLFTGASLLVSEITDYKEADTEQIKQNPINYNNLIIIGGIIAGLYLWKK